MPDRCHDGSPGPCPGGGAGGLPAADGLLTQIVPKILASPAFKSDGLLVITVDEAPSSGEFADSSSCCGQPRFPNLPPPTGVAASLPPEGGGQVGALLLSPFVKAHTTSQEPYDHFSLLRTIEDLFGLKHLGYAGGAHVSSLEPSLFQRKAGGLGREQLVVGDRLAPPRGSAQEALERDHVMRVLQVGGVQVDAQGFARQQAAGADQRGRQRSLEAARACPCPRPGRAGARRPRRGLAGDGGRRAVRPTSETCPAARCAARGCRRRRAPRSRPARRPPA